ncbi:unnamed protein product [Caenorhabditis auriculariae]|uniref:Cation/H+ exchanger transmembrane domain-containing protein n=1 Tax=Caenorhabditis auriculariae TaxID=2777116 RepID=A0A8S1GZH4_9PELO|nr:unnamed protein product [Caenorhabditis auriculariae]
MSELSIFVFPAASLVVALTLEVVNNKVRFLGIPDSVFQFTFAIFAAMATFLFLPHEIAKEVTEKYTWNQVSPQAILVITLPPLLFEAAFRVKSHMFFNKLKLIVSLTGAAYIGTIIISAGVLLPMFCITDYLRISSANPVAVVAILEQYGAPHRLRVLIEGESLLNDGAALMFYHMFVSYLRMETIRDFQVDYKWMAIELVMCLAGSPLIGWVAAQLCALLVSKAAGNPQRQLIIFLFVYGVFIFCDKIHGSSAVGLVFFGVMLNYCKEQMSPETCEMALQLWQVLGYLANGLIFMFAGYLVGSEMFTDVVHREHGDDDYADVLTNEMFTFLQGVLVSPVPFFARAASLYMFYNVFGYFSKRPMPAPKDFVILSYAGLRGALGLILSMELVKDVRSPDCKKVLILVSATTVTCLIFQGMTFSSVAFKEGSTKRSKYVKETCTRMSRFLTNKVQEEITNWEVASAEVSSCLAHHTHELEQEMVDLDEGEWASPESKGVAEVTEAKIGLYGILLARVHDSWETGALSGNCAHMIVALLEHGIDEGNITALDIEEHMQMFEPSFFILALLSVFRVFRKWLRKCGWLCNVAPVMSNPLIVTFSKKAKVQKAIPRTFEIWYIFHTLVFVFFTIFLAYNLFEKEVVLLKKRFELFIQNDVEKCENLVLLLLCLLSIAFEAMAIMHIKYKDPPSTERAFEIVTTSLELSMAISALGIQITMLFGGRCFFSNSLNFECLYMSIAVLAIMMIISLYRITRATPIFIIVLARERLRLAVFYFLHHLMHEASSKISHDLFGDSAYKIVKKEIRHFSKLLEGLMRLEFKENVEELDVVAVIKTRQAIRMMSYNLHKILNNLQKEGFIPSETEERWNEVVKELRSNADSLQFVAQLSYSDYLVNVKWIQKLRETTRRDVIRILAEALSAKEPIRLAAKEMITTNGSCFYFIKKGIVKMTEWVPCQLEFRNEVYQMQGDFIGTRNLLLMDSRRENEALPLLFPKRRYETTTYCEIIWIDGDIMKRMLKADSGLCQAVGAYVQSSRLITEISHVVKTPDIKEKFWDHFARHGRTISTRETINVPDGKIAFIGCWTNIVAIVPRIHLDRNLLFVRGPAAMCIEPVSPKVHGYIYIDKETFRDVSSTTNDSDNISIVHDTDMKVVVKHAAHKKMSSSDAPRARESVRSIEHKMSAQSTQPSLVTNEEVLQPQSTQEGTTISGASRNGQSPAGILNPGIGVKSDEKLKKSGKKSETREKQSSNEKHRNDQVGSRDFARQNDEVHDVQHGGSHETRGSQKMDHFHLRKPKASRSNETHREEQRPKKQSTNEKQRNEQLASLEKVHKTWNETHRRSKQSTKNDTIRVDRSRVAIRKSDEKDGI